MDRVDAFFLGDADDAVDVEIGGDRALALPDQIGLVRLEAVDAEPVFLRVNGDGAQAEFGAGAEDADGDFAAVGGHQLLDGPQHGGLEGEAGVLAGTEGERVLMKRLGVKTKKIIDMNRARKDQGERKRLRLSDGTRGLGAADLDFLFLR